MAENIRIMQQEAPVEGRKFIRPSGYSKRLRFAQEKADALGLTGPLTEIAKVFAAEAQKSIDAGSADVVPGHLVTAGAKVAGIEITGVKMKVLLDVPSDANSSGYKTIAGIEKPANDGSSLFGGQGVEEDDPEVDTYNDPEEDED